MKIQIHGGSIREVRQAAVEAAELSWTIRARGQKEYYRRRCAS
ncbi:MAG: hypothetical protein V7631_2803 [Massilia sp.]|jgi:hypothetical protein